MRAKIKVQPHKNIGKGYEKREKNSNSKMKKRNRAKGEDHLHKQIQPPNLRSRKKKTNENSLQRSDQIVSFSLLENQFKYQNRNKTIAKKPEQIKKKKDENIRNQM